MPGKKIVMTAAKQLLTAMGGGLISCLFSWPECREREWTEEETENTRNKYKGDN